MINTHFDVVVVGELNVDIILNNIDSFPEIGKEKIAQDMTVTLGSSSAIFASNLSSLGAKVTFLGKIGCDNFAAVITESLQKAGVDTNSIIRTPQFNTGATIVLNYDQDRAMVTYPGAMNDFKIQDVDFDLCSNARHLHFSSCFLQPGIKNDLGKLLQKAKSLGLTTSVDPQWDPAEKWDLDLENILPNIDVFLPNTTELKLLTKTNSIKDALEKVKPFAKNIVIKDGSNGAYLWDGTELIHQPAFLNQAVVDCIGAGDSFNSGFISRFILKRPIRECLEFGAVVGAINTTCAGGTTAFENIEKIKTIARETFHYTF